MAVNGGEGGHGPRAVDGWRRSTGLRKEAAHLQNKSRRGAVNPTAVVVVVVDVMEEVVDIALQRGIVRRIQDHVEIADAGLEPDDLGCRRGDSRSCQSKDKGIEQSSQHQDTCGTYVAS